MSQPQTAAIVLAAASATAVCASQTPGAAGAMTVNGGSAVAGVATLDAARRVLITTAGADAGKTVVLQGTDRNGQPIIETLVLPSAGTVQSVQDFKTVTVATISAAAAAAITIGTNGVASTRWMRLDSNRAVFNASCAVNFGGATASVTVESTLDAIDKSFVDSGPKGNMDSSVQGLSSSTFIAPFPIIVLAGVVADQIVSLTPPVAAVRLTVVSGATTVGVRVVVIQQGI